MRSVSGTWNFSSLGSSSTASPASAAPAAGNSSESATESLSVKKLDTKDGRAHHHAAPAFLKPGFYPRGERHGARFFFRAGAFPFTVTANLPGNGTLKLQGTGGPINSSDASLTRLQSQVSVKHFDLAESEIGDFSPGISGTANFDGAVSSDGQELRTGGTLQADQLKLAANGAPRAGRCNSSMRWSIDLHSQSGTLTQGDIAMGRAVAHLTGTFRCRVHRQC